LGRKLIIDSNLLLRRKMIPEDNEFAEAAGKVGVEL